VNLALITVAFNIRELHIAYDIDNLLRQADQQTHLGGRSTQTTDFRLREKHALKT